ncbi:MAG: hypothetical protein K1000chlam4_00618 [Chlamydiae bacterium]|nr:hypothetical protein [Chlamydiota bacterium]
MSEAIIATPIIDKKIDSLVSKENQGTLKGVEVEGKSKEYSIFSFLDTEAMSQEAYDLICSFNAVPLPEVLDFQATLITLSEVEIYTEIMDLLGKLESHEGKESQPTPSLAKNSPEVKRETFLSPLQPKNKAQQSANSQSSESHSEPTRMPSSIFMLAKMMHKEKGDRTKNEQTKHQSVIQEAQTVRENKKMTFTETKKFRDKDEERGSQQDKQEQKREQPKEKRSKIKIDMIQTSKTYKNETRVESQEAAGEPEGPSENAGNIFYRVMALMARILGQAEAEAQALYLRIKGRTDDIDTLITLASKINSADGNIDWSKDEEMKKLVERARELGVDIPEGKYAWNEEEKELLKENIQMRKDSMEKISQLERTDMQRYLQEASQCHQARSNILKLYKEVMDTIIHNLRP